MSRPLVVLVGPPGSGKSTVAALLAARLGGIHRDTDTDVETSTGQSIADLFVDSGEAAFRELERAAVVAALTGAEGNDHDRSVDRAGAAGAADDGNAEAAEAADGGGSVGDGGVVLSVGGGAILDAATRADLAGHTVVFLDVSLTEAAKRVGLGVSRPLLLGNVRTQLKKQLDTRRPFYLEVAGLTVDTDGRTPEQLADEIAAHLARVDR